MTKSREWFQNESLTDDQLLARCDEQFCRGPIGLWSTYGNELTLFTGLSIWFSANSSGIVYFWDIPETKYELKTEFRWRCDRDFEVELDPINHANPADRWGRIKYKFQITHNEYKIRQIQIVEVDSPEAVGSDDFLWSVRPLHLLTQKFSEEHLLPGEDV